MVGQGGAVGHVVGRRRCAPSRHHRRHPRPRHGQMWRQRRRRWRRRRGQQRLAPPSAPRRWPVAPLPTAVPSHPQPRRGPPAQRRQRLALQYPPLPCRPAARSIGPALAHSRGSPQRDGGDPPNAPRLRLDAQQRLAGSGLRRHDRVESLLGDPHHVHVEGVPTARSRRARPGCGSRAPADCAAEAHLCPPPPLTPTPGVTAAEATAGACHHVGRGDHPIGIAKRPVQHIRRPTHLGRRGNDHVGEISGGETRRDGAKGRCIAAASVD